MEIGKIREERPEQIRFFEMYIIEEAHRRYEAQEEAKRKANRKR